MAKKNVVGISAGEQYVDPTMPGVALILGNETYKLCFTFGALATAEAELRKAGRIVNMLHSFDFRNMGASDIAPLVYAGLLHYHPQMSMEKVESLVNIRNLGDILGALILAYEQAVGEPKKNAQSGPGALEES